MSTVIATFIESGRTGGIPYVLAIVEHPRRLERYEVRCVHLDKGGTLWVEAFTTITPAVERFCDELKVMTRDYDESEYQKCE